MLVEGRHFLPTVMPQRLGHKALAVNLSDLAACGAEPLAFTLALAMPRADEHFLQPFAQGLFEVADAHGIELVGGDTTAGPLNICVTVFGEVPAGQALLRSGARAGDELWVSGTLGDARLALECFRGTLSLAGADFDAVRAAMELPQPRTALGQRLRGIASASVKASGSAPHAARSLRFTASALWPRRCGSTVGRKWRPSTSMSLDTHSCRPGVGVSSAQSSPMPTSARRSGRRK
jgi:thiamine-monophosphate kinase